MGRVAICLLLCASVSGCGVTLTPPEQAGRMITALSASNALRPQGPWEIPGSSHQPYIGNVVRWLETQGFRVTFETPIPGCDECMGMSLLPTKQVWIDSSQPPNSQLATLLHEAAHILVLPTNLKTVHEIVAEMIAYLTARNIGLNTQLESFSYLANVHPDVREMVLQRYRVEIMQAVQTLTAVLKLPR